MGFAIVAGGNPGMKVPVTGIQAGTLAVGSVVKLMEGDTAVEYLVVNQGKPSGSSLYDDSCDGTWLLRKDIHSNRQWHTSNVNVYETSAINTWLNGDFFNSLGSIEQAAVRQVKIPYRSGGGSGGTDQSGANGLPCRVFLPSGTEIGFTSSAVDYLPHDGMKLLYFESGIGTAANNKRIGYLNGSVTRWFTRSPYRNNTSSVFDVFPTGKNDLLGSSTSYGIRPALVIPKNALFDETTMILKGAA